LKRILEEAFFVGEGKSQGGRKEKIVKEKGRGEELGKKAEGKKGSNPGKQLWGENYIRRSKSFGKKRSEGRIAKFFAKTLTKGGAPEAGPNPRGEHS